MAARSQTGGDGVSKEGTQVGERFVDGVRYIECTLPDTGDKIHIIRDDPAMDATEEAERNAKQQAILQADPWFSRPFVLENNDCSRIHKLQQSMVESKVTHEWLERPLDPLNVEVLMAVKSFVIQHDWARAFAGAVDYDEGGVRLPFPECAFEFIISGRPVILHATETPPDDEIWNDHHQDGYGIGDGLHIGCLYLKTGQDSWYSYATKHDDNDPLQTFVWNQVRAVCIALDAEIATRDIVRAPAALNKHREKSGKAPLVDYHVVALHGRHGARKFSGGGTHKSPRLHFRRGHWRHYEQHKTWIKWMLVGDPSLGFIDKDYRL